MARQMSFARKPLIIVGALLTVMALLIEVGGLNAVGASAPQASPFCLSDELLSQSLRQNPALQKTMREQERLIQNHVESRPGGRIRQQSPASSFIIPVVVYIIYKGCPENIDEQQVNSQITALNNAFSGCGANHESST